jgi:hypothetical protein
VLSSLPHNLTMYALSLRTGSSLDQGLEQL